MPPLKPVRWIGSAHAAVRAFPSEVRLVVGQALYEAQAGGRHRAAKPLKGFGGAGVLEIVDDFDGDAYRAVYTVKIAGVVCVLHAFQKKSKTYQHPEARDGPCTAAALRGGATLWK